MILHWRHSEGISLAEDGAAVVMEGDEGWEALPFGLEGGSAGCYPTREAAIDIVEGVVGDMVCCVGHLASDSDR